VSTETSVAVLVIGGALVAWIFNLVRQDRLYVGYGVIFGVAITTAAVVVGLLPTSKKNTAASSAFTDFIFMTFVQAHLRRKDQLLKP
jgi:hypothetical protein